MKSTRKYFFIKLSQKNCFFNLWTKLEQDFKDWLPPLCIRFILLWLALWLHCRIGLAACDGSGELHGLCTRILNNQWPTGARHTALPGRIFWRSLEDLCWIFLWKCSARMVTECSELGHAHMPICRIVCPFSLIARLFIQIRSGKRYFGKS